MIARTTPRPSAFPLTHLFCCRACRDVVLDVGPRSRGMPLPEKLRAKKLWPHLCPSCRTRAGAARH